MKNSKNFCEKTPRNDKTLLLTNICIVLPDYKIRGLGEGDSVTYAGKH